MTDGGYTVNKGLVNALIVSCLTAIVVIGAYMVTWNISDKSWKSGVDVRLDTMSQSVSKIESKLDVQILPEARWRLEKVESWLDSHEKKHHHIRTNP